MRPMLTFTASAIVVTTSFAQSARTDGDDPVPKLVPEITRAEIEAHVRFLASDALAGRSTGTPEAERAARYLAAVLKASGIEPAGDDGTYLQRVPLERLSASAPPELVLAAKDGSAITAAAGVDFEVAPRLELATKELRVVVVRAADEIPKEPDANVALFVDAGFGERRRWFDGKTGTAGFGLLLGSGSDRKGKPFTVGRGGLGRPSAAPRGADWVTLRGDLLQRAKRGELATVRLATHVRREKIDGHNVVGILRGTSSDAALAKEAVVISAHYDHLHAGDDGPDPATGKKPEDVIYNGADDDASGCAAVLELAGRFASGSKPARTLVFLLATGEEIGLLGTEEYLDHPVVALDATVANLNFEMIGRPDPLVGGAGKLWLTGFELTNLGAAYAQKELPIAVDPRPGEHFFERSDNFAFVQRGVVGQTFSTYNMHGDYHHVSDEADTLDYPHMEACVRAGHAAVELVASGELRPAWLEGKDPRAKKRNAGSK